MTHRPDDDLDLDQLHVFHPEEDDDDLDAGEVEDEPKPALDEVTAALLRGDYPRSTLVGLSDLTAREAGTFKAAWARVDGRVREAVVSELNDLAEERVDYRFDRALLAMLDDPDPVVRQGAVAGLWEHEDRRFAATLAAILESDESEDVRAEAARGLGRFAEMAELGDFEPGLADRVISALLATLADPAESMHVRARALESASILADNDIVLDAISDFFDEEDTGFRATAIYAMGRSLQGRFLSTILNETSSDDAEIRYEAARAAGFLGDTEALPVLAELAKDEDAEVRQAAINAMGEIGGTAASRYLRRLAEEASDTEIDLIEAALEDASIVSDPLLLDDNDTA
jgi:HEAT repeat protein